MRVDMQVHTHCSPDGLSSPEKIMKAAKQRVDVVAITDHNTTAAWRDAERAAKRHGVLVVRGEEVKIMEDGRKIGEVLLFFLDKEVRPGTFEEVRNAAKQQDALVAISHPFGHFGYEDYSLLRKRVRRVHAVEAFNSRSFGFLNRKALAFAHKHKKPVTAGSDAHAWPEVGLSFMQAEASSLEEFRKKLLKKQAKAYWRPSPLAYSFASAVKKRVAKIKKGLA